jgi:hypothetical protein
MAYEIVHMNTLRSQLDSLASNFASAVVRAIQSASLEELLTEVGGKRRPGGSPAPVSSRTTAAPRTRKPGRLPRRSVEDIKAALDKVHGLLKSSKGGMRAEQIRVALKLDAREMPRVLKEGLASKKLTSKGQKRATTYFAR